jgi:hypothetical protein
MAVQDSTAIVDNRHLFETACIVELPRREYNQRWGNRRPTDRLRSTGDCQTPSGWVCLYTEALTG